MNILISISNILCGISIISLCCIVVQYQKNTEAKQKSLSDKINNFEFHLKKDIQVWTGQADHARKEFKKFENIYIHQMGEVNERLKKLEQSMEILVND